MNKLALGLVISLVAATGYCNPAADNLATMSEKARRSFTGMLIRQAGADCPSVQRTFLQGAMDKSIVWNVACPRASYGILFVDDAANTVRVMKCTQMPSLGAPPCFKKMKSSPV